MNEGSLKWSRKFGSFTEIECLPPSAVVTNFTNYNDSEQTETQESKENDAGERKMKKKTKQIISKVLVAVIVATSIGYSPPPVLAARAKTETMQEAMKELASPSEATTPDIVATPSEAENSGGKATPSEAVKKFIRIEPEEIPEYYSQESASWKKFWKFKDRNGIVQYRDYGYIQGDTEFPLWYEADSQGTISEDSINEDDEFYELAPYLYKSAAPAKASWSDLSWKLFNDSESIFLFDREKSGSFKNWDHSTYDIWSVNGLLESEEDMEEEIQDTDLGYFFYGQISNERDPVNDWYYADSKGEIWSMSNMLMVSLLASQYYYDWWMDVPGELRLINGTRKDFNTDKIVIGTRTDWGGRTDVAIENGIDFNNKFIGWFNNRSQDNSITIPQYNASGAVIGYNQMQGDPAKISKYFTSGTLYSPNYQIDTATYYPKTYYGVWCPENADMYIFASEEASEDKRIVNFGISSMDYGISSIIVRRNSSFNTDLVSLPKKKGYEFSGWRKNSGYGEIVPAGTTIACGDKGEVTWLFPSFIPLENTVRFLDADGNVLKEETVLSGNSATPPTPPEIEGKRFTGWDKPLTNVTEDMEIKPKYEKYYTVTVDANGGEFQNGQSSYSFEVLESETLNDFYSESQTASFVTKKGYTFDSFRTNADGTGSSLAYGIKLTADTTYYAKWRINYYTISYYANVPGKGDGYLSNVKKSYGDPYGTLKEVSEKGYKFLGWFTDPESGEQATSETIMGDANVKLYGHWEKLFCEVTLYDGIPDSTWTQTLRVWAGDDLYTILSNQTTQKRTGYIPQGWYTGPNGTGERIYSSSSETILKNPQITVYKYWKARSVIIRLVLNENASDTYQWKYIQQYYDSPVGEIPTPSMTGKVFSGWYTARTGGERVTAESITKAINPDEANPDWELYAHWANPENTVIFKDWNGDELKNQTVAFGEDAAPPEDPVREGYRFIGWDKPYTSIEEDTVLTAQYEISSRLLTLDGNGGSISGKLTVEASITPGDSIDQMLADSKNAAIRKYYTFAGWHSAPSGGSKYPESGNLMPDTDLTVYAQWERSSSEVTFKDWNGTVLNTQEVAIGADAAPPETPERTGYTFTGWDKPYTTIQDHITITAQYTANSHTLTLDGNDGTLAGEETKVQEFDYGESFDQALTNGKENAVRRFYTFAGWYTAPSGGSKYPESGNRMPDTDLTVYAQWERSSSEVIFKDWDETVLEKQEILIGADATPPEVPERPGYTFTGWDKPYTSIQDHSTITARYTINSHKLILDGNDGTLAGEETKVQAFDYGDSFDQALTNGKEEAARRFYTFTGWYTAPTEGNKYSESGNRMPDTNLTVYAQWERSSSEVTFKDWNETTLDTQDVTIGADAKPPEVPERPGYTFAGWDKPYTDIQDHKIITAQYTINGYLLTLDGNGGILEGNARKDQVLSFNQSYDQVLKDGKDLVSRPGYSFDGWYTSASGGSSYLYTGNLMPAINVTVFAHWTANTYKITFDPDHVRWTGGVTTEEHTFDTILGNLPAPEIYGWKFTGWWTGKHGTGTEVTNDSMVEPKDVVYYGNWEPETYQIPFISRVEQPEGESVQTFTVGLRDGQPFGNLSVPEEKGHTFTGWFDMENKRVDSQTIFHADSEAEGPTYHAGWKANTYKNHFVYHDADGKPVVKEIEATYGTQYGPLPTPEKPGYTFFGWFKDNGEEVTAGSWVEPGETEYKARWSANHYTIHFERNLPESDVTENPKDKTVTYGFPIGELPMLQETGYLFLGWYTEHSGGTRIKETTFAALGDQTYYGHWATGWIDNGDGTYRRPGADGKWNTPDDELWWKGPDGIAGTDDDKLIHVIPGGGSYVDNGDGTNTRPGEGGSWKPGDTEHWQNGPDGVPGTSDDYKKDGNGNTDPEPTKPEPSNEPSNGSEDSKEIVTPPAIPSIDTTIKPSVPDDGGTFQVNSENPQDVTYTKPDGSSASNEWIGNGTDYYHVNEDSKLDYDWFLDEDGTWYMLNNKPGETFGAALRNWYVESMDTKEYFFDPGTTKMLTGWQHIDDRWYFFTPRNEGQTYFGSNRTKWKYDPLRPGKPYGSMYRNEYTPDGYWVDENGVYVDK